MPDGRGTCSCGWRGPWRSNPADAMADVRDHVAEKGCELGVTTTPAAIATVENLPDDRMPHERAR